MTSHHPACTHQYALGNTQGRRRKRRTKRNKSVTRAQARTTHTATVEGDGRCLTSKACGPSLRTTTASSDKTCSTVSDTQGSQSARHPQNRPLSTAAASHAPPCAQDHTAAAPTASKAHKLTSNTPTHRTCVCMSSAAAESSANRVRPTHTPHVCVHVYTTLLLSI